MQWLLAYATIAALVPTVNAAGVEKLRARSLRATSQRQGGPDGVGNPKDFAHLLPFHPEEQPETMFKSRCTDFLNQVLEKAAYDPLVVMGYLPECKWSATECASLQDDLSKRLSLALPSSLLAVGQAFTTAKNSTARVAARKTSASKQNATANAAVTKASAFARNSTSTVAAKITSASKQNATANAAVKKTSESAKTATSDPEGPLPTTLADSARQELYGWCDTMYTMAHAKAVAEMP